MMAIQIKNGPGNNKRTLHESRYNNPASLPRFFYTTQKLNHTQILQHDS